MSGYSDGDIQVLTGLAPVRKRPGMYVGDTGNGQGIFHMVWDLVTSVIDEHVAGYASELRVELGPDSWISIHDDGMGFPTDLVVDGGEPVSALERIFLRLHAGGFRRHPPPHSRGFHVEGGAVVNALSEELQVETTYQGVRWSMAFARGERTVGLRRHGVTKQVRNTLRFRPDPQIFATTAIDRELLEKRLRDIAWLHPHLRVWFQEQRLEGRGGITEWARTLAAERGEIVERFTMSRTVRDAHVTMAFAWNASGKPFVRSFVNAQRTAGGSHVDGMWAGFCEYARSRKSPAGGNAHVREAIGCGLVVVIHVTSPDPWYTSQTRMELCSPPIASAVRAAVLACVNSDAMSWKRRFLDARLLVNR